MKKVSKKINSHKEDYPIDIVLIWVDGSDKEWRAEKAKYSGEDKRDSKYRDWDLLKYWFRGVEKFAPWVNKVHFVTCGHLPKWLNTECPKLNIVKHSDYIPSKYLPTFSSHPIELNLHRIPGLAEHFVYLNDDTYFLKETKPTDFFKCGKPKDRAILNINCVRKGWEIQYINTNNIGLINRDYDFRNTIRANLSKWFNLAYGLENLRNLWLLPCPRFPGIKHEHANSNFLKSTFNEAWNKYRDELDETSSNKFRRITDVNQYLFRYLNLINGSFVPGRRISKFIDLKYDSSLRNAEKSIRNKATKIVCINDAENIDNLKFEKMKKTLDEAFSSILPDKSLFEK